MTKPQPIALDAALGEHVGEVTLFGRVHPVLGLNGAEYQRLNLLGETVGIMDTYDIVARIVPSLVPEEVQTLTARVVGMILAVADGRIEEVRAAFPNVERPTTSTPVSSPA